MVQRRSRRSIPAQSFLRSRVPRQREARSRRSMRRSSRMAGAIEGESLIAKATGGTAKPQDMSQLSSRQMEWQFAALVDRRSSRRHADAELAGVHRNGGRGSRPDLREGLRCRPIVNRRSTAWRSDRSLRNRCGHHRRAFVSEASRSRANAYARRHRLWGRIQRRKKAYMFAIDYLRIKTSRRQIRRWRPKQ